MAKPLTREEILHHAQNLFERELQRYEAAYYAKRKYGKWTIYNKEGWRVAHGLNEKEKNNYMKLLEEKE